MNNSNSFLIVLYCIFWFALTGFVNSLNFHLNISAAEREEIFGTRDENVPDYDLVIVSYLFDPDIPRKCMRFPYENEIVTLTMNKMDSLSISRKTSIWLIQKKTHASKINFTTVPTDAFHDALEFYEDPSNMAGIGIDRDNLGKIRFTGYIKDRLVLKKVPESVYAVWDELFNKNGHRLKKSAKTPDSTRYHILIKHQISMNESMPLEVVKSKLVKRHAVPPYNGPDIIYPRILVFVNLKTRFTSALDPRFYKLLVYLVCFWNSVNMKYIEFEKPRIRFHIAGFVIGMTDLAAPYLRDTALPGESVSLSTAALQGFIDFVRDNDPKHGHWDIAVSQADVRFCSRARSCNEYSFTAGIAFIGALCNVREEDKSRTAALVYDAFDFSGVRTAAHEIGHLFGAKHDGSSSIKCDDHGFIMSPVEKKCQFCMDSWSTCSKLDILKRIRKRPDRCWNITTSVDYTDEVPEILPGHIISLEEQCKVRGYNNACHDETTCEVLYCWHSHEYIPDIFQQCEEAGPPMPGTYCGKGMHCKYQLCFPREKFNMTNY